MRAFLKPCSPTTSSHLLCVVETPHWKPQKTRGPNINGVNTQYVQNLIDTRIITPSRFIFLLCSFFSSPLFSPQARPYGRRQEVSTSSILMQRDLRFHSECDCKVVTDASKPILTRRLGPKMASTALLCRISTNPSLRKFN